MSTRDKKQTILNDLRRFDGAQPIELVLQLVDLLFEDAKNRMVTAPPEGLLGVQSEAKAYQHLKKELTRKPLETNNKD